MKKSIYILAAVAALFTASCGEYKTTESGVRYKVLSKGDGEANNDTSSLIYANYRIAVESTDSVLVETFTSGKAGYIPVFEPTMKEALTKLVKGDSAEILINADTFFMNSFGQARPPFVKEGDHIKFTVKINDIFSQDQMRKKEEMEMQDLSQKDSLERSAAIAAMPDAKSTDKGVFYVTTINGTGKQVKKGDKLKVLYKGMLLNGQVFDENQKDGIELTVGLGQVIPGWESMLMQMKEGQKVRAIIPWSQAYGPRGNGPIPPYSTLVFEMEILKIN
ncbi:MAG: FKBP-type peptidyl-prolyl cis-trans isomerase [Bacteroidota bacterium]